MKTKSQKLKFADLPKDYSKLCGILLPRPIHDRAGYENALELIEAMAGFEAEFTEDQNDYFSVIADFVGSYEDSNPRSRRDSNPQPPLERLLHLLDENGMSAADLSRLLGVDRTLGAKILRGERNLTVVHLRVLADRFKVSPALFI